MRSASWRSSPSASTTTTRSTSCASVQATSNRPRGGRRGRGWWSFYAQSAKTPYSSLTTQPLISPSLPKPCGAPEFLPLFFEPTARCASPACCFRIFHGTTSLRYERRFTSRSGERHVALADARAVATLFKALAERSGFADGQAIRGAARPAGAGRGFICGRPHRAMTALRGE